MTLNGNLKSCAGSKLNFKNQSWKRKVNYLTLKVSWQTKTDIAEIKEYIKRQAIIEEASKAISMLESNLKSIDEELRILENRVEDLNSELSLTKNKRD